VVIFISNLKSLIAEPLSKISLLHGMEKEFKIALSTDSSTYGFKKFKQNASTDG
jgi:hypothetical protein